MKTPSRNGTVILTAALGVGMLVNTPQPAAAQDEDSQGQVCSLETIEGSYGWTTTGWIVSAGPVGPVADVGVISFDGNGGATQTSTVSLSGSVQTRSSLSGSYKVNPDCTGSITMVFQGPAGPLEFHDNLVIVNHGRELRTIVSDNGRVLAGTAIRQ